MSQISEPYPQFIHSHFIPSTDTIRNVVYNDWRTINGIISHNVTHMVTPAVLVSGSVWVWVCVGGADYTELYNCKILS